MERFIGLLAMKNYLWLWIKIEGYRSKIVGQLDGCRWKLLSPSGCTVGWARVTGQLCSLNGTCRRQRRWGPARTGGKPTTSWPITTSRRTSLTWPTSMLRSVRCSLRWDASLLLGEVESMERGTGSKVLKGPMAEQESARYINGCV